MSTKAIIYARISNDREGEGQGVTRQIEECQERAEREGMTLIGEPLRDDSLSAWRSGVHRPAYEHLLRLVRERQVDVVLVWHMSRLWRGRVERATGIDVFKAAGVRLVVVKGSEIDFSTAMGRSVAGMLGEVDTMESDLKSERILAQKEQAAEQGRYRGGRRPFGYRTEESLNEHGKKVKTMVLVEEEADALRWATEQVIAGRSLAAVARALNDKGITTTSGNQWRHTNLGDLLLRPRNAGLVSKGRRQHVEIVSEKAEWEPVVTREQWQAVQDLLADPSRRTHDSTDTRWIGSGIYRCGRDGCDSPMRTVFVGSTRSRKGPKVRFYRCGTGSHLTIKAEPTDEYVTDTVCAYLGDPRVVAGLSDDSERTAADRTRREALVARLRRTEKDYDDDLIDGRRYKAKGDKLRAEIEEIDQRLTVGVQRTAAGKVLNAEDPGEAFRKAPVDVQRAVLRLMVSVAILPAERRGAAWSTDRVVVGPAE